MFRSLQVGLLVAVATAAGCRPPSTVPASSRSVPSTPVLTTSQRLLADSAASQKATLELARLKLLSKLEAWAPQVRELDEQLFAVDLQLLRLPSVAALQAMDRVLAVVDQREAGLQIELDQLRVKYTDAAVPVIRAEEELQQLTLRRMELQVQRGLYGVK